MNLDLSIFWESITELINGFIAQLPQIILGLVVLVVFYFVAKGMKTLVHHAFTTTKLSDQAGIAIGRVVQWGTIIFGILVAMTIIFPSIDPASLLSTLGVTGVAVGFAFRDILQNFFAGLILLLTEPFSIGDQITVDDYSGTVKRIETRATTIHTYDGRDVIIPNSELFTDSVIVNTAHGHRRSQYDVGIGYGDNIAEAKKVMLGAMKAVDGVLSEPVPEALVVDLADSTVNIRIRWWTDSQRSSVIHVQDRVLQMVAVRLTEAGIDMPFPTQVLLFHDQTEETDGDRARQREGWPVPANGKVPQPQRVVDVLKTAVNGNDRS